MHKQLHRCMQCVGVFQFEEFYIHSGVKRFKRKNVHNEWGAICTSSNKITFVARKLKENYFPPSQKIHFVLDVYNSVQPNRRGRNSSWIKQHFWLWKFDMIKNIQVVKATLFRLRLFRVFHTSLVCGLVILTEIPLFSNL